MHQNISFPFPSLRLSPLRLPLDIYLSALTIKEIDINKIQSILGWVLWLPIMELMQIITERANQVTLWLGKHIQLTPTRTAVAYTWGLAVGR